VCGEWFFRRQIDWLRRMPFADASFEVISFVNVSWACEYEVMDVFGYTPASCLWAIRGVVFPYPVEVLVDRSVACT